MKDQIVVITGAASGMGLAVAKQLAKSNQVVSIDRNPSKIAALRNVLPEVMSVKADLTVRAEREAAIARIGEVHGRIDVLFNNAGKGGPFDFVGSSEDDLMRSIESELAINYQAPILLTKHALPLLRKSQRPMVIVSSTGLVYMPMAAIGTYCAAKAAVHVFTMSLRHQLAPLGIRVVEVLPPSVDTELNFAKGVAKMAPDEFARQFLLKLERGAEVINVGQSAALQRISRLAPGLAFRMLNRRAPA